MWKQNVDLAEQANEPGKFTAFCSYEWTSMPNNMNLHRNIFFKDCAKVPAMPFSALDSSYPEDLWNWMDGQRKAGNELLAISHNANLSDGRMYPTEVDSQGPADRRRLCRVARSQRAPDRDQADQGHVGDAPAAVAQRRVRELRDPVRAARQPARAACRTSSAATRGRR